MFGPNDGIPVEVFQILKDDAVKVLNSICQQIWKTRQWPQYWERSAFISHASKVMLKIPQARLQQYMNRELPDVQAGFRKGRKLEIKLPTSVGSQQKQRIPEKHLCLLH